MLKGIVITMYHKFLRQKLMFPSFQNSHKCIQFLILCGITQISTLQLFTKISSGIPDKLDFDCLFMCSIRPTVCIYDTICWQNSRFMLSFVRQMNREYLKKKDSKSSQNLIKLECNHSSWP